jgi:hypothetical protein
MRTPALAQPLSPISPVDDLDGFLAWHRARFGDATMNTPAGGESGPPAVAGGGESAPPASGGAPPAGGTGAPAPAGAPAAPPAAPPANPPAPAEQPGKVEDLPAWAQKIITDTRAEAATHRTGKSAAEQKQTELMEGLAKVLGLKQDEPVDPAKLQQTVSEKDALLRTRDIELAAWHAADRGGAKASALLDSRSFVETVSKLDPAADDFTTKLDAAVKTAVDANPLLRAGQAPARGGSEFPGGPGGESKPTSLHEAVAARMAGNGT